MDEENRDLLSADIEYNVLPLMYDSAMAVGDAHTLLIQDTTISPEVKNKLTVSYPCQTDRDKADLLAAVLFFGMEREFRKRDVNNKALLASGCFSPLMRDFILDVKDHATTSAVVMQSWKSSMNFFAQRERCSFRVSPVLVKAN